MVRSCVKALGCDALVGQLGLVGSVGPIRGNLTVSVAAKEMPHYLCDTVRIDLQYRTDPDSAVQRMVPYEQRYP